MIEIIVGSPHERSNMRGCENPDIAEPVIGRAFARPVGSSGLRLLSPQFGDSIRVTIDTDRIDALAADRAALWDRVSNAAFLTLNEKREAVGYGPVAGGDRWG
jgi:phage portal protein BeeE